ncbi:hypothetical protein PLESTB_000784700 [Pleodorina starrii]|uniref:Hemerythrin-like domain-containing protein n=1 Tax=Pleodorina starrii TaxID=330485 RepID=A0A9W6BL35_9CHLO|nr:hypothetical protein PLESTM_000500200 [Pleodorina starrii]GLC53765.1 hypothetical protein PLESTB_000784700 [Pleodorina starrii]GLC72945.1 hypothetical protein PLESTF_001312300 [Pleodorina starrii]
MASATAEQEQEQRVAATEPAALPISKEQPPAEAQVLSPAGEAESAGAGTAATGRPPTPTNGLDAIVADHLVIKQLFGRYDTAATAQAKLAAGRDLVRHISRHASAEERTLYPLVREKHPQPGLARMLYDRMVNKHMLNFLESHVPASEAEWTLYDTTLAKFRAVEEEHLATEEAEVIEPLRAVLDPAALAKLGRKWSSAFANAPTHPHPGGPSDAAGARLLHPVVGLIDRVRDALTTEPGGNLKAAAGTGTHAPAASQ